MRSLLSIYMLWAHIAPPPHSIRTKLKSAKNAYILKTTTQKNSAYFNTFSQIKIGWLNFPHPPHHPIRSKVKRSLQKLRIWCLFDIFKCVICLIYFVGIICSFTKGLKAFKIHLKVLWFFYIKVMIIYKYRDCWRKLPVDYSRLHYNIDAIDIFLRNAIMYNWISSCLG